MSRARSRRGARGVRFRPNLEGMEGRQMLSAGIPPAAAQGAHEANENYLDRLNVELAFGTLPEETTDALARMLDRGASHRRVVGIIQGLPETRRIEVVAAYRTLLDRSPTARELGAGLGLLRAGLDERAIRRQVLASREYYAKAGGTDSAFVASLYQRLLGRDPAPGEADRPVALLGLGAPRRAVVNSFLAAPEALANSARVVALATPGAPTPGQMARAIGTLRRPGGLRALDAAVFSSPVYYARASATPSLLPPATAAPFHPADVRPAGLPLGKDWDIGTRWTQLTQAPPTNFSISAISNGADGTIWLAYSLLGIESALEIYDQATATTTNVTTLPGTIVSIGSTSATSAWIVLGTGEAKQVANSGGEWSVADVPSLPGGDAFAQISTAADGTTWALGKSGTPYSYSPGGSGSWTARATGGATLGAISVGSATNIWAVGTLPGGQPTAMSFQSGEFRPDPSFAPKGGPSQISATADGTAWAVSGGALYSRPVAVGAWSPVTTKSPTEQPVAAPGAISAIAGISQYRLLAVTGSTSLQLLSYGVADQPATGYPAMNAGEAIGYSYISNFLGVAGAGGIRSVYDDALYANSIPGWPGIITTLSLEAPPPHVAQADWDSITAQLIEETNYVNFVFSLFTNINALVQQVQGVAQAELGNAAKLIALSDAQSTSTVDLYLEAMFEAAFWGVAAAGLPPAYAVAASAVASGVGSWLSAITGDPNPTDQTTLQTTQVKLSSQLNSLYEKSNIANGYYEDSILSDWGRLKVIGEAIKSKQLAWDYSEIPTIASYADDGFSSYFFSTLMPIRWNAVAYKSSQIYSYIYRHIPQYDVYFLSSVFHGQQLVSGDFRFIHVKDGANNPFIANAGPFPVQPLLQAIYNLGVSQEDLFTGANGWLSVFVY